MQYQVGGHCFSLYIRQGAIPEEWLTPYLPFRIDDSNESESLFTLSVVEDEASLPTETERLTVLTDDDGETTELFRTDEGMLFHFALPGRDVCCRLYITSSYRQGTVCLSGTPTEQSYGLNTSLMILYAFASATSDTLLLHASVIEHNGRGHLFLGKSGTGKSTHSRLWLEHIEGSTLLNDDNPVIRIVNGEAVVFGTPWSGKTPCYKNRSLPVGSIVRLAQAPHNRISRLSLPVAYAALLPACSHMKWNSVMAAAIHRTIERVITRGVPVFRLECLPHQSAARLCADSV